AIDQLRGDDIGVQRYLRAGDALGEIEDEVALVDALGQVEQVGDADVEGLGARRGGHGLSLRLARRVVVRPRHVLPLTAHPERAGAAAGRGTESPGRGTGPTRHY